MSGDTPHSDDIARLAAICDRKPYGEPLPQPGDAAENVVVPLRAAAPAINDSAVNILEDALEMAKSGKLSAVAIAIVLNGRETMTSISKSNDYHMLNSSAARLAARLATSDGEDLPVLPSVD